MKSGNADVSNSQTFNEEFKSLATGSVLGKRRSDFESKSQSNETI